MRIINVVMLAAILWGCGSSDSDSDAESDEVGVSGQMMLEDFDEDFLPDTLITLKTLGGSIDSSEGAIDSLELDENGSFSLSLSKVDEKLAALVKAINADGTVDRELIKSVVPDADLDDLSDADLIKELESMQEDVEGQGGPLFLLVGAKTDGVGVGLADTTIEEKAAIAATFRFLGLPGGSGNFIGFPPGVAKSDIAMGELSKDATDEMKSTLELSTDTFDLSEDVLDLLSSTDDVLKGVKNSYINTSWTAQPFFLWNSTTTDKSVIDGQYSDPTDVTLGGFGFYVGGDDAPFSFEDVCNETEADRKSLQLYPPSEVVVIQSDVEITLDADTPFDNSGSVNLSEQDGSDACSADGTGFYARDDGDGQFMINYGTGGSIQGSIPSGFWDYKYDGSLIGKFEMGTSSPTDDSGNPVVFIPSVKVTTNSSGVITKVEAKFNYYDQAQKKFVTVDNTDALDRLISEFNSEITRDSDTGSDDDATETRTEFEYVSGGVFAVEEFDLDIKLTGEESDSEAVASDVSISYMIGENTYRFEFRE